MKVLHIMRERNDPLALKAAMAAGSDETAVLLLHDSVLSELPEGLTAYACKDDVEARGIEIPHPTLDYGEIVQLLFRYDSVITW
jgi:sulfur relay protein TusB/DsrH